jgi:hypothetical protein
LIQVDQSNILHDINDEIPIENEIKGDASQKKIKLISKLASGEDPVLETSQIDSMIMKH